MTSERVEIVVCEGETFKIYYLHKSLLCDNSAYFRKCLASGMLEANSKKVVLDDVKIEAFEVVVHWLYRKGHCKIPDEELPFYWVYNLADRLCMEKLKNAVVDRLKQTWCNKYTTAANLVTAFEDLDPDTKLGMFLIDKLAYDYARGATEGNEELSNLDHRVLLKVTAAWARACKRKQDWSDVEWTRSNPVKDERCTYHEHNNTPPLCEDLQPPEAHMIQSAVANPVSARAWQLYQKIEKLQVDSTDPTFISPSASVDISTLSDYSGLTECKIHELVNEISHNGYIEHWYDDDGDPDGWIISVYQTQEEYEEAHGERNGSREEEFAEAKMADA